MTNYSSFFIAGDWIRKTGVLWISLCIAFVVPNVVNARSLSKLAVGEHRSSENIARNKYRHPVETLLFFGLQSDMHVIELWPGSGWYTEIIAPYLLGAGRLTVGNYPELGLKNKRYLEVFARQFKKRLDTQPKIFGDTRLVIFYPPEQMNMGESDSQDMVLSFRNFHNWYNDGYLKKVLKEVYRVLKPGGVFGVVAHRGDEDKPVKAQARMGYLPQSFVIQSVEKMGFKLDKVAQINANSKDKKDYTRGVWSLPPTLLLGDFDKDYYLSIGESDRMTLRFVKPVN